MNTRLSLIAAGLGAGTALALLAASTPGLPAAEATPPNYGNVSGPGVPSNAPGATDATGTGPDASQGVTHAQSSGPTRNSSRPDARETGTPENYGTVSGPGATRDTPGADDGTGTGPDASTGITHVHSGGATQQSLTQPPFPSNYSPGSR